VSDPLCHAPITVPRSVSGGHAPDACRRRPAEPRSEAAEALRSLVDATVLVPAGDELTIELKGNLAAMLSAAQNAKRSPEGDLSLQIALVAGARNRRYRPPSTWWLLRFPSGTLGLGARRARGSPSRRRATVRMDLARRPG
jgi:hypothetical protein